MRKIHFLRLSLQGYIHTHKLSQANEPYQRGKVLHLNENSGMSRLS